MNLIINGENMKLPVSTLIEIVEHFNLNENLIVTEVDGIIINEEDRTNIKLKDGMRVEIVQFVGGG